MSRDLKEGREGRADLEEEVFRQRLQGQNLGGGNRRRVCLRGRGEAPRLEQREREKGVSR